MAIASEIPAPAPEPEATTSDEEETEESADDATGGYSKGPEAKITRSAVAIVALPKTRLAEVIELLHEPYDSTVTAEYSGPVLAQMIWIFCRVKPCVKIAELRVQTYSGLGSLLLKAKKRLTASMGVSKFEDKVIIPLGDNPASEVVSQVASDLGFQVEWLNTKKVAPKARGGQQLLLQLGPARNANASPAVPPLDESATGEPTDAAATPAPIIPRDAPAVAAPLMDAEPRTVAAPISVAGNQAAPRTPMIDWILGAPTPGDQAGQATLATADLQLSPDIIRQAMALWMQQQNQASVVAPVVLAPAPAPALEQVEEEPSICLICRSNLGATSEHGVSEALLCAHVYHEDCLDRYCSATGKTRDQCCPLKCNTSAYITIDGGAADAGDGVGENHDDEPLPAADQEALQLAQQALADADNFLQS